MATIEYYLATLSPYCYLAGTRLEEIAGRHGASVTYRPLDFNALLSRTGGVRVADRHPNRLEYRAQDLLRQAARLGMPFHLKPAHWPTNGAPAAYAIIAAGKSVAAGGPGDMGALCHGILRACWSEEKNVAEDGVIRDCLSAAGFDPALADKGLFTSADDYERNLEDAVVAGAFGTPFYVVRETGERFWGQDRLDDLDSYLATL